ncbi:MAG: efflux RND transporter permease subunit [Planctomycetes bacterium]|nr:efflux RND transporter permease subunit [Planctomycetota bacterium]
MSAAHDSRGAIALFVARPVATLTLLAVLIALGFIAYLRIPIQLLPKGWGSQNLTVIIPNPNSNPRETEDRVTRVAEEQIRTIPGVRHVRSQSRSSEANIHIEFAGDQDMDVAYAEVHDRLEKVRSQLPRGSDRYIIFRFSLDESAPIFFGGLLFNSDPYDSKVNDLCENVLRRRIEGVPGVARMNIMGMLEESIRILLNVDSVRAHRVNLAELVQRLAKDNFASPAGKMEEGGTKYLLRVDSRFQDLDEIRNIPIGNGLRIRDIGEVKRVQAIRESLTRVSDLKEKKMKYALVCAISKVSGANTVETCKHVLEAMKELEARPDMQGFRFDPWFNQGEMIAQSLRKLQDASKDGAWFSIAILFFFLRRIRLTLLIALAIPVSLLVTLVSLYFTGSSFNIISMAGITLAIGSLVDNAVVVVENIHRKKELGESLHQSVIDGAGEVAVAITLATLTSIVVFVPLIFFGEERSLKIAMAALGYPFAVSLLASLMAALVFIPVALYRLERAHDSRFEQFLRKSRTVLFAPAAIISSIPGRILRRGKVSSAAPAAGARGEIESVTESSFVLRNLKKFNEWLLRWSLQHRLMATLLAFGFMASTQFPQERVEVSGGGGGDGGGVGIRVDLPQNTTLEQASAEMEVYENLLLAHYDEFKFFDLASDFTRTSGNVTIWFSRAFTKTEHDDLRRRIREILPARASSLARLEESGGGGERSGVRFVLIGRDSDQLASIGENVKKTLQSVPELTNVRSELERGRPEVRVRIDRERAQKMSLNPLAISGAIEWGLRGYMISRMQDRDVERQVIIQYKGAEDSTMGDLADTKIYNDKGVEMPLATFAKFEVGKGYGEIFRRDGRTSLAISADVLSGDAKTAFAKSREALAPLLLELPREVTLDEEGALQDYEKDAKEILIALMLSILLVYVVMAVMFEDFVLPFSIIVTIPFAFFGAYWTLYLTKTPMDQLGLLGMIVLVGVVVNHGVVLVDHINFLRVREKLDRTTAVVRGSRDRLRPVLMTSLATIVGLVPMALADDSSGQGISYKVLAIAVCGGLATCTFFTLWVVPLSYTLFDDLSVAIGRSLKAAVAPLIKNTATNANIAISSRAVDPV